MWRALFTSLLLWTTIFMTSSLFVLQYHHRRGGRQGRVDEARLANERRAVRDTLLLPIFQSTFSFLISCLAPPPATHAPTAPAQLIVSEQEVGLSSHDLAFFPNHEHLALCFGA
ncbi:hypothetical protein R3P38DRAFT_1112386 [Favolaschia claudopus]|uniref:Secreted protein n=1 Tax=Favolaschia claudopus TaxID=2862362 RepID=A0AAW0B7R2_9AGAR